MTTSTSIAALELHRISTPEADFYFLAADTQGALNAYAVKGGSASFADLAAVLSQTVDEAEAEVHVEVSSYEALVAGIVAEAIEAGGEGAEDRFETVREWADWCVEGKDGTEAKSLADLHGLDHDDVINVLRSSLEAKADLAAINAGLPAAAADDEEDTLPRVEKGGKAIDGEEILPGDFMYFAADGTEYAYSYRGQEEYEVRRWMPESSAWWVHPTERYADDVTVELFLTMQNEA